MGVFDFAMMARFATLFLVLAALHVATAFYLPGVAPRKYSPGEQLHIRMTTMTSSDDELLRDYYRINFCAPEGEQAREYPENLGELLVGERSESSVYEIYALDNQYCKVACSKEWTQDDVKTWYELAADNYRVNMKLDNLPAAELFSYTGTDGAEHSYYQLGYSLGSVATCEGNQTCNWYIHNHVTFKILYHRVNSSYESIEESGVLIVGFDIFPRSIQHSVGDDNTPQGCLEEGPLTINVGPDAPEKQPVHFTYDVTWEHSDIKWASRWDVFLNVAQTDIHWFSVVNSIVVLALLSGMVAMIMLRILRKDVYRYNRVSDSESEEMTQEMREETGWKLVCADVFRPPRAAALLAVCVGSGVQVIGMTSAAMVFASLGLLNPSNRGGLLSVMIAVFIIMGNPAGFCAAVFAKRMQVQSRLKIAILTASLIPGVIFAIFFVLNMVIWGERSVGAVPFGTIVALCVLWFIAVPLVFLGSFWGFRKELSDTPTRTNSIPREVPEQPWYMTLWPSVLMGAVLPFGVVFVELFFVLSAIWQHRFYYLFGFIMLVIFILIITCAEITIVMTYFQLCSEDYHWWWRAFLTAGCSAVYFFLYSMMHYFRHLHHSGHPWASTFIYCCYSLIVSYMFFFLTGVAGFIPTYVFVWVIYSSIKVD